MPKTSFVDFNAVRAAITMEAVLEHYGLLDRFTRKGETLIGPCPIHKGSNPTQFHVSLEKNLWHCFSECKHGGNALDFIMKMENLSVHAAALKAIDWFKLDPESMTGNGAEERHENGSAGNGETPAPNHQPQTPTNTDAGDAANKPLKFRLDKLELNHPYLIERGLTQETVIDFGAGYCTKGMMAGRIAIPIHNSQGEVLAYVGRFAGEPKEETPKYKLPPGFKKSLELFNIDRAAKEPADTPLIIVEGFFDCMKLHQLGHRKVVALMGSSMSKTQEEIIRKHTTPESRLIVILDEDEAGQAGRDDIACRLAKFCFVKVHVFDKPGRQPEHLSAQELQAIGKA
jgi:DNA primase